jgi:hypothetical protein
LERRGLRDEGFGPETDGVGELSEKRQHLAQIHDRDATGMPSGSIYRDRILPRGREGVVIKTHALDAHPYTHAVHLVRNPFDAICSYFHWKRDVDDQDVSWDEHVAQAVQEWRAHTEYWRAVKKPVFRLRYEDLLRDSPTELARVLSWLELDVTADGISRAVASARLENMRARAPKLGDKFFRQGRSGTGAGQFTSAQRRAAAVSLHHLLRELDYSPWQETSVGS